MAVLISKLVAGGQTGADRGGLDAAIALGIPHGGWCPKGRRAEDGKVPARYALRETDASNYQNRTRRNVVDSDGTVVFTPGEPTGGSRLTVEIAREVGKPCLHLDTKSLAVLATDATKAFQAWIIQHGVRTLNVAGARESKAPGTHATVAEFLRRALQVAEYNRQDVELFLRAAEDEANYSDADAK